MFSWEMMGIFSADFSTSKGFIVREAKRIPCYTHDPYIELPLPQWGVGGERGYMNLQVAAFGPT